MNKGSEWRKWNFHVHTKGTKKNDQFSSPTIDDFFCEFFKKAVEFQISAIGITDYFSLDRYLDALEYKKSIKSKVLSDGSSLFTADEISFIENIFLFPNVELRMMPSTDKGRLINIHCLFNPDYVPELENDFFGHISNHDDAKMNRAGITLYGKGLDSNLTDQNQQYQKGLDNFVIDLKQLKNLIKANKKFRDNSMFVVSNSNNDGASGLQMHYDLFENENGSLDGLRKSIYELSHAIFSSNQKDIQYFLGKKSEGSAGYNEDIQKKETTEVIVNRGSLKPCLVGCDSHSEASLHTKFTWIKADLTFEGLRQICFEPSYRVKIQAEKPDFKQDKLLIEKFRFISANNTFPNNYIHLNPNLNVIIGGKSSGKSILLYTLAKTLLADHSILKNDDGTYKYDLDKIENNLDFEIVTKGGFSQRLIRPNEQNSILPEIKYIPQNYLVKLAEPDINKKGKSLNELVRDLITEDDNAKEIYQLFLSKVIQNDKLRNTQIDLFFEIIQEINSLEAELKTKSSKLVLEQNIQANSIKVEDLNKSSGLTAEEVEKYKTLQTALQSKDGELQKFKDDFNSTQKFNSELYQLARSLKQKKDVFINTLQSNDLKIYCEEIYQAIDTLLTASEDVNKSIQVDTKEDGRRILANDGKFKEILSRITLERKSLNTELEPFQKDVQIKKTIDGLNLAIAQDKKSVADIDILTSKIQEKKKLLDEARAEIFRIYESNHLEYKNVILALRERTIELEKDGLDITGTAQFNFPKLRAKLAVISDGRTASFNKYSILSDNKRASDSSDFTEIRKEIESLFDDLTSKKYVLNNKTTIPSAIKIILEDYFFDSWQISFKNDTLGQMSTGKASFVILMLIIGLSKSKAPILIDQPEDNLDNRSITTDLVNYLRKKKLERQIIIVTHNANIVVNADSENVIVANQKGQSDELSTSPFKFDYINGSIENSFDKISSESDILKSMGIRQHIADIVEGGKEAFLMREKKYRFN